MIITISGPHGSGKSTVAKLLAKEFNLTYISAGHIFRSIAKARGLSLEDFSLIAESDPEIDKLIDYQTKIEGLKGNTLIDAQLSGWLLRDHASISVFITAPFMIRAERISKRDGTTLEYAIQETRTREVSEAKRFKELYGIDIGDQSIYDLVVNTSRFNIDETFKIVRSAIAEVILPREQESQMKD